jgi:D-alanyl-lipoteichoic acid acyltransferase DltB (MBOAT superfamily)
MTLGGLWHGASWNFVFWGIYHGICLVVHREFVVLKESKEIIAKIVDSKIGKLLSIVFTFNIVTIGWVFFRVHDFSQAIGITKKMILLRPIFSRVEAGHFLAIRPDLPIIVPVAIVLTLGFLLLNIPLSYLNEKGIFKKLPPLTKAAFCSLVLIILVTFSQDSSQPFIYFQF